MIINPKIKSVFQEIAKQSLTYANSPDPDRKHYKRFLTIFKNKLTEDEQMYIIKFIFESLHYKNIVTDPDNVLMLHSIKLKNITYIFFLTLIILLFAAILFKTNDTLNGVVDVIMNAFKLLSI